MNAPAVTCATASPGVALDPLVAGTAERGQTCDRVLLAELSHIDPDSNPLHFAHVWARIQAATRDAAM